MEWKPRSMYAPSPHRGVSRPLGGDEAPAELRRLLAVLAGLSAAAFALSVILMSGRAVDPEMRAAVLHLRGSMTPRMDSTLFIVSKVLEKLSGAPVTFTIAAGVGAYFALARKEWRPGVIFIVLVVGALMATGTLKDIVDRRPPRISVEARDGSPSAFPSGHAAQAVAVLGWLAFLISRRRRRSLGVAVAVACAFSVAAGVSRVFLNAHWASDVVGGWGVGGCILCVAIALDISARRRAARPVPCAPDGRD
jgi:membrane-associated phospholipid phosphatase